MILAELQRKNPQGITELHRNLNNPPPISTLQKYLTKGQTFFKKTDDKKWSLPGSIVNRNEDIQQQNTRKVLESQIEGIAATSEIIASQLQTFLLLAQNHIQPPVAEAPDIDQRLLELYKKTQASKDLIQKYKKVIPEEYRDLLVNLDLLGLTLAKGTVYTNAVIAKPLSDLCLEISDKLPDEIVDVLASYQIGKENEG